MRGSGDGRDGKDLASEGRAKVGEGGGGGGWIGNRTLKLGRW